MIWLLTGWSVKKVTTVVTDQLELTTNRKARWETPVINVTTLWRRVWTHRKNCGLPLTTCIIKKIWQAVVSSSIIHFWTATKATRVQIWKRSRNSHSCLWPALSLLKSVRCVMIPHSVWVRRHCRTIHPSAAVAADYEIRCPRLNWVHPKRLSMIA